MHTLQDMPKDEIFKLRLETAERAQLDALAAMRGVSAAQMVRMLISEAAAELAEDEKSTYRISAWDGSRTTCLFWVGRDREAGIARAKELAKKHVEGPWTVFRVFRGDDEEPIYRASVPRGGNPETRVRNKAEAIASDIERGPRGGKR